MSSKEQVKTVTAEEIRKRVKQILDKKPELVPPPDGLWESIHATWTGLWTDFHSGWDERQPSDIFPVNDFLSVEREESFTNELASLVIEGKMDTLNKLCDIYNLKFEPNGEFTPFGKLKPEQIADFFLSVGKELRELESQKTKLQNESTPPNTNTNHRETKLRTLTPHQQTKSK